MSLALLYSMLMDPSQNNHVQPPPFIPEFGMSLQGDQVCRWAVQRAARRAGWKLKSWCSFDPKSFPGYTPSRSNGEPFPYQHCRFYLFELQHRHGAKPVETKEECAICLMEMKDDNAVLLSSCNHIFCKTCLDRVISVAAEQSGSTARRGSSTSETGAACPLCRKPFHLHHMTRQQVQLRAR
jgi:hypothetical protein